MPGFPASSFSLRVAAVFFLLLLVGCDTVNDSLPKVFGSEVPPDVLNAPRVVPSPPPSSVDAQWPLVGAVPPRPKNFTPQPLIDATKAQMKNDRATGLQLEQTVPDAAPDQP